MNWYLFDAKLADRPYTYIGCYPAARKRPNQPKEPTQC